MERNYRMKILWSALLHRATINSKVLYTLQECKWGAHLPFLGRSACRWIYRVRSLSVHDSFGTWWLRYIWDEFRYMCFCSTTSVHVKYHSGTSLCRYRYIAREHLSFLCWRSANAECMLVCYVKLLMCNWTFFFTTSTIDHRWPIRERINVNKHVASDVSWKGAARLSHRSAQWEC